MLERLLDVDLGEAPHQLDTQENVGQGRNLLLPDMAGSTGMMGL
jgi:hypothetical protein